jgi:D-glycero-alpha-D-manno-heptose-7-phosphate kinase
VPVSSGLGASSAIYVAQILARSRAQFFDRQMVAMMAWENERIIDGKPGGIQDQFAATFGGFNLLEITRGPRVKVKPLRLLSETIQILEGNLLLCYTGAPHLSDSVIQDQSARTEAHNPQTLEALRAQKSLAFGMAAALMGGEIFTFGKLLAAAWESKKNISPKVTNKRIDQLFRAAYSAGGIGGKITGAGGGGHLLMMCKPLKRQSVAKALESEGCEVVDFRFEPRGAYRIACDTHGCPDDHEKTH